MCVSRFEEMWRTVGKYSSTSIAETIIFLFVETAPLPRFSEFETSRRREFLSPPPQQEGRICESRSFHSECDST